MIKDATCTEDGLSEADCKSGCGNINQVIIPATGHTYLNDWAEILSPACTSQGVKIKVCSDCAFVNYETLPSLGHIDGDADEICDNCSFVLNEKEEEKDTAAEPDDKAENETDKDDINTDDTGTDANVTFSIFDRILDFFERVMAFLEKYFSLIK